MAKGKKYPEEFIQKHLSNFRKSGLGPTAYCKNQNIPRSTFHSWEKRNKNNQPPLKDFIEIELPQDQKSESSSLEIQHGDFSISVPELFSNEQLISVLTCMKEALGDTTSRH